MTTTPFTHTAQEVRFGSRRIHLTEAGEGYPVLLEKMRTIVRDYLVFDSSQVPDALIADRFEASRDPEVMAAPPLVLWGAADKVNRPSGGRTLQATMRNCDLYLFANTGHWVQWERADEFNACFATFLARHTPKERR